jgi:hypothetical protein
MGATSPPPPGYVHWTGSLPLRYSEEAVVLPIRRPGAGRSIIELRYRGRTDICPIAGWLDVTVGAGPALAEPPARYAEDPLVRLGALC